MQVFKLPHIGEVVDYKNVGDAVSIQFVNQVAADEARTTGDNQHAWKFSLVFKN